MKINEFAEVVRERLVGEVEESTEIEIKEILKNNSVTLRALLFKNKKSNITPTIYLEPFYARYKQGTDLDDIVTMILNSYQESQINEHIDLSFFREWEAVKSRVAYRLINHDRNVGLLKQIPHKDVLDLAKVYYIALYEYGGSILIYEHHLEMWGIDAKELDIVAEENTPALYPVCIKSMWDAVNEMLGEIPSDEDSSSKEMLIMSNPSQVHGAATMLYPGCMEEVADRFQSNFYILPSSIHESIILPVHKAGNTKQLLEMVREINATVVGDEEILGDNIYYYDRELKEIKIVA